MRLVGNPVRRLLSREISDHLQRKLSREHNNNKRCENDEAKTNRNEIIKHGKGWIEHTKRDIR